MPQTFQVLQEAGGVDSAEMFRVFNMGIGMLAVVPASESAQVVERIEATGQRAWVCGEVAAGVGVEVA